MGNSNCDKCAHKEMCRWLDDLEGAVKRWHPDGKASVVPNLYSVRDYLPNMCKRYEEATQ